MGGSANQVPPSSVCSSRFKVAGWTVDPRALTIAKGDETRHLEIKVMALLVCLASRPGEAITRREFEEQVWPDVVVGYGSLTKAVIKLRQALGDDSRSPGIIETVPKVGYRLIAAVERPCPPAEEDFATINSDQEAPGRWDQPRVVVGGHSPTRLGMSVATVLLVVAISVIWWQSGTPDLEPVSPQSMALPLPDKPSIAVLPFDNLSGDREQDHLSDGLTDVITTELSHFKNFFVIARNSTKAYKRDPVKVQQVSRDLGVRYVLEGSVQTSGDRVRVTTQLIDAIEGKHIWADTYDRKLREIFAIQDEITRSIVMTIEDTINLAEYERTRRKPVDNLDAYELSVRGREKALTFTREGNEAAKQLLEKAVEIDPEHVESLKWLAYAHLADYRRGWNESRSREESLELALEYANKALALAPFYHGAHWIVGKIHMHAGNFDKAVVEYNRAMELNPNDAGILAESASLMVSLGRPDKALDRIRTAMRLNPRHADWYYWSLGDAQYALGQCETAVSSYRTMNDMPAWAMDNLAAALVCAGHVEEARETVKQLLEREPEFSMANTGITRLLDNKLADRYTEDLLLAGLPEEQ